MEAWLWIQKGLELFGAVTAPIGLLLTAYTIHKDEKARRIGNLFAITSQYREIWKQLYDEPALFRVLERNVDLRKAPVSNEEWLFVKLLILHLNDVHRAIKAGMFVNLEGLEKDIRDFYSAPIPKAVWEKLRPYQDREFINFVENKLR